MPFCVAGVALCDIARVSEGVCLHGRRGSKVAGSMLSSCEKSSVSRCRKKS